MYRVGDKVVYPVHGAGEVVAIERREVGGRLREYYILNLPFSGLRVSVPLAEAERLGLRRLMSGREAEQVLEILCGEANAGGKFPEKWAHRSRLLVDKIKAGNVCELAEVVRCLAERERRRALAGGEKKLFEQARDILLSELRLVEGNISAADSEQARRLRQVLADLEKTE